MERGELGGGGRGRGRARGKGRVRGRGRSRGRGRGGGGRAVLAAGVSEFELGLAGLYGPHEQPASVLSALPPQLVIEVRPDSNPPPPDLNPARIPALVPSWLPPGATAPALGADHHHHHQAAAAEGAGAGAGAGASGAEGAGAGAGAAGAAAAAAAAGAGADGVEGAGAAAAAAAGSNIALLTHSPAVQASGDSPAVQASGDSPAVQASGGQCVSVAPGCSDEDVWIRLRPKHQVTTAAAAAAHLGPPALPLPDSEPGSWGSTAAGAPQDPATANIPRPTRTMTTSALPLPLLHPPHGLQTALLEHTYARACKQAGGGVGGGGKTG